MQVGGPPKPGEPTDLQKTNLKKWILFVVLLCFVFVVRHLRVDQPPKPGEPKDTNVKECHQQKKTLLS
jgi:hypothetical protein